MLLLSILLLPVVLGANWEWNFGKYVVKTNENNTLTGIEKTADETFVELDLSNLGLEGIDSNAFVNVTNIKSLNLANNWLTTLPKHAFTTFNYLQHLSLADNNTSSLDGVFFGRGHLQTLDLSNNQLEQIGDSYLFGLGSPVYILTKVNDFSNISTLSFEKPNDPLEKAIPENKSVITTNSTNTNFTALEVCTDNYWLFKLMRYFGKRGSVDCTVIRDDHTNLRMSLKYVYENFWDLGSEIVNDLPENIVELDLTHNIMYRLREGAIENLYLRTLIVDQNEVRSIDDNALAKTNLSVLSLNYNSIQNTDFAKTLPSSLKEIRLSHNNIIQILPGSFSRIKNLVELDLSHNSLHETAFAKTLPSSLEEIRFSHNKIEAIPPGSFSSLKNLVKLDLSQNFLTNIEANSFRNLGALRELNLYNNTIYIYKGIFAGLRNIEYLNIGMNRLNDTENILFAMPDTLATVILDSNEIESLEVGSFIRVPKHKLSLKGNNIHSFVEGSFDLPNLEELDLGSNELTQLDKKSFKGLANLKRLSLAKNKMMRLNGGDLEFLYNLEILDFSWNPIKKLGMRDLSGTAISQRSVVLLSSLPIELIR